MDNGTLALYIVVGAVLVFGAGWMLLSLLDYFLGQNPFR